MWRAITDEDVLDGLSDTESNVYRTVASVSATDPLPGIIAKVSDKIRTAIRSWRDNRLHEDESFVPEGCIDDAVALIRYRLLNKLDQQISEGRRDEYKEALAYLRDIRAGKVSIERPDEQPDAPAPAPGPRISARKRRFSRDQQEGI